MPTLGVVISEGGTITLDAVVARRQRKKGAVLRVFWSFGVGRNTQHSFFAAWNAPTHQSPVSGEEKTPSLVAQNIGCDK